MDNTDHATDFSASFCTWLLHDQPSYGRFGIESLLRIEGETPARYLLASAVMAGRVYASGPLIHEPAYEFAAVFSDSDHKIFRTYALDGSVSDEHGALPKKFKAVSMHVVSRPVSRLAGNDEIARAALDNATLVARAEFDSWPGGCRVVAEFPVKHINIQTARCVFQVETGPVLVADPFAGAAPTVDNLLQAYVFFNRLDEAHLILRRAAWANGARVRRYGETHVCPARISLMALA